MARQTPPPSAANKTHKTIKGEDGEARWVLYQLGYIALGLGGVIGLCVSLTWLVHIIIYMLPPVPIHPLLNEVFIKLDGVFPLFGVAAFAGFCFYLLIVAIKGNFMLGLNFVVVSLYPVRVGATMMSRFVFFLGFFVFITVFCLRGPSHTQPHPLTHPTPEQTQTQKKLPRQHRAHPAHEQRRHPVLRERLRRVRRRDRHL